MTDAFPGWGSRMRTPDPDSRLGEWGGQTKPPERAPGVVLDHAGACDGLVKRLALAPGARQSRCGAVGSSEGTCSGAMEVSIRQAHEVRTSHGGCSPARGNDPPTDG